MADDQRGIRRKLRIRKRARLSGDVRRTCLYFGVGRASFYRWRQAYRAKGGAGLANKRSVPHNHPNRTHRRSWRRFSICGAHHLGPMRIVWYLARRHGIKISDAGVHRILCRNGLSRLPRSARVRKVHTRRHDERAPGHHIQMDVKFLSFIGKNDEKVRRFRYTAIDDPARVRALKVHERHDRADATDLVDHVIETFPSRIKEIRTDNRHEFQAKLHRRVEDKGTAPCLSWLQGRKLSALIPVLGRTAQTGGKLGRKALAYDADRDSFTCAEGHGLTFRSVAKDTGVGR